MMNLKRYVRGMLLACAMLVPLGMSNAQTDTVPEGAVLIAEMPEGILQFKGGIQLPYAEGWTIYEEDTTYIESNALLIYGESLLNYQSQVVISINDASTFPLELGREMVFGMTSMLYTGREDFVAERDIIQETLEDGRVIEYLDTSGAPDLLGNSLLVPLDARYWAWLMFTHVLNPEESQARAAEVLAMARGMRMDIPEGAIELEGFNLVPQVAECTRTVRIEDVNQNVPYAVFECPADCVKNGETASVWGTDIYTLDSGLCTAAVHAGAINDAEGGTVLVTWQAGQESYASTERNGVISSEWGAWGDSFKVEPFDPLLFLQVTGNGTPTGQASGTNNSGAGTTSNTPASTSKAFDCVDPQNGTWSYTPQPVTLNTCPSIVMSLFNTFHGAQTLAIDFGTPFDFRNLMIANADEAIPGDMTLANPSACNYTATYTGTEGTFVYAWIVQSAARIEGSYSFNFAEDFNCQLELPFVIERVGD